MDDMSDKADVYEAGSQAEEGCQAGSDALDLAATTLVEVTPGVAVVFGQVPDGIDLIGLDMVPSFDREQLSNALGFLGDAGTIVGNLAEAVSSAKGLFRVDDATLSLLKSGGEMATKDGAKLGAIFKDGDLVAQARFIPVSTTTASALAAIGPAVAMIALQMQLGEISGLVRTNIQLTTQTLKAIRNEQWAELEGLAESVGEAVAEIRELDAITESVWEPIAPKGADIRKQLKLYRNNVGDHVLKLGTVDGQSRRQYLESNAEAIVFDTYALLSSLKTHAEYRAVRAALARTRGTNDQSEVQLFERIARNTPAEIDESLSEIKQLTASLVRELRVIAELPGRATVPLTKKRRDAKASQLTCRQLLEAIEPLADMLQPPVEMPAVPKTVCAPEGLELDPYLHILRWFLEDGETVRCVAFPYVVGDHNFAGILPAVLARRVDASWDALSPRRAGAILERVAPSTFVAVTDRRVITADPKELLKRGELGPIYPLDEVRHVRSRPAGAADVRATVDVATQDRDFHWMFPGTADTADLDSLTAALSERAPHATPAPAAIVGSPPTSPAHQ